MDVQRQLNTSKKHMLPLLTLTVMRNKSPLLILIYHFECHYCWTVDRIFFCFIYHTNFFFFFTDYKTKVLWFHTKTIGTTSKIAAKNFAFKLLWVVCLTVKISICHKRSIKVCLKPFFYLLHFFLFYFLHWHCLTTFRIMQVSASQKIQQKNYLII